MTQSLDEQAAFSTYHPVAEEQDPASKKLYWDVAFGLQAVDHLAPSSYMRQLAHEHIAGQKTYQQVHHDITAYYHDHPHSQPDEKEADKVATAIQGILADQAFRFDPLTLQNYHRHLFDGLDPQKYRPGQWRTYNITKNEPILNGATVQYQTYDLIETTLQYDFHQEKAIDYTRYTPHEIVARISEFTSNIWQIHPFCEGNTRTTAVFVQKYLASLGFQVQASIFKEHSLYFRDALVRANYTNYPQGVKATTKYLQLFFENLLLGKNNPLQGSDLQIDSSASSTSH